MKCKINISSTHRIKNKRLIKILVGTCVDKEGCLAKSISIIITTDPRLLEINKQFLKHNYHTDVITFELNDKNKAIEGEIYISSDRVKENAILYKTSTENELRRVVVHGVLHLCGFGDKTKKEKETMRQKENYYLGLYDNNISRETSK